MATMIEAGVPVALVSMGGLSVPAGAPQPGFKHIADTLKATPRRPESRRASRRWAATWPGPRRQPMPPRCRPSWG